MRYFNTGNDRGVVAVLTAVSVLVLMGMMVFGIDMGYLFLVRGQLQNASDSGALAGASKLVFLLPQGASGSALEARNEAIDYATRHLGAERMVQAGDVEVFLSKEGVAYGVDANGTLVDNPDLSFASAESINIFLGNSPAIMVIVRRTGASPVQLFFGQILGRPTAEVQAFAVARLVPLGGTCGFTPWMIRDWPFTDPINLGDLATLKYRTCGQEVECPEREAPGWFSPVQFPPINKPECGSPEPGAAVYRENITQGSSCTCLIEIGDTLRVEEGNKVGPTLQGVEALIAMDPGAVYNTGTNEVDGSQFADWTQSPRIVNVLIFDPNLVLTPSTREVNVVKIGAFFIDDVAGTGNGVDITGHFVGITTSGGIPDPSAPSFIFTTQLIR